MNNFGVPIAVVEDVYRQLGGHLSRMELLMGLNFLRHYDTDSQGAQKFKVSINTYRSAYKRAISKIADTLVVVCKIFYLEISENL